MTEFPVGYYAARAVTQSDAEKLFPGNSSKNQEKQRKYVDENWNKIHPSIMKTLELWKYKQKCNVFHKEQ
jgi:hypothetical protein